MLNVHKHEVMHTWERSNPTFSNKVMGPEQIMITRVHASAMQVWHEHMEENRQFYENTSSVPSNHENSKWQVNNY